MIKSSLTTSVVEAYIGNYSQGRSGRKVCKITPHHVAGVCSGTQCAQIFQNPARYASSNYCIGNAGDIVCCVGEENRAWTSSSWDNDTQAITIEVSNCEVGGQWKISDAAWNSLVNLCVDICKRYGFKLVYDGTPNGSLTRHNMFAATSCPGPYLQGRFQELADTVNARLEEPKPEPAPAPVAGFQVGSMVRIKRGAPSYDGIPLAGFVYDNVYRIDELNGKRAVLDVTGICTPVNTDNLILEGGSKPAPIVTTKTVGNCYWLNLRTTPSWGNNIFTAVPAGTVVEYLGIEAGWAKIKHNGRVLYCGQDYLK